MIVTVNACADRKNKEVQSIKNSTIELRDLIIHLLQRNYYKELSWTDINGVKSAAADIALPKDGGTEVFRIVVVRHSAKDTLPS